MRNILKIIGFVVGITGANSAVAGQCGYEYCWGGVGFSPNGQVGWTFGRWSEEDAYNEVQEGCGWQCTEVRTFYNACGAMAQGVNGGWGWAYGGTRAEAENLALNYCGQYTYNCRVTVWACSP